MSGLKDITYVMPTIGSHDSLIYSFNKHLLFVLCQTLLLALGIHQQMNRPLPSMELTSSSFFFFFKEFFIFKKYLFGCVQDLYGIMKDLPFWHMEDSIVVAQA